MAFFLCGCWLLSAAESQRWHRPRVLKGVALAILICILLNAGIRQVCVGARIAELQRATRPEIELLKWAQSNLPVGSVIGTVDPDLMLMIPVMGANFTYVPPGLRSLTPTDEIIDRYYQLASLLGLSKEEVEAIATPSSHNSRDSQLLWVLRVYVEAVSTPQSNGSGDSQILGMSRYGETRQTFSKGYRQYQGVPVDRQRRLDYVVSSAGTPIPAGITQRFFHAHTLYVNQQYQLIALR